MWLQAGKYLAAVMSDLPERNGWSIARHAGDATPDKTQRLLNHARWDTVAAMSIARRGRLAGGMQAGALDETGQEKHGGHIDRAGVKRQYMGCAGPVANVHRFRTR